VWVFGDRTLTEPPIHHVMMVVISLDTQIIQLNVAENATVYISRVSTPQVDGRFKNAVFDSLKSPWAENTTSVALDLLRYVAAQVVVGASPPPYRSLIGFDDYEWPLTPLTVEDVQSLRRQALESSGDIPAWTALSSLTNAVKEFTSVWGDIVNVFKTSSKTEVRQLIRLGFNHFMEKSTVMKAFGLPADKVSAFEDLMVPAFDIPDTKQTRLALFSLQYTSDYSWDKEEMLYNKQGTSTDKSFLLFKNGDSQTNLANFLLVNVEADFNLAPDLLIIHTQTSILGGLFQFDKVKIQEVPHVLSLNDVLALRAFFRIVAFGKMCDVLGISYKFPDIPPI